MIAGLLSLPDMSCLNITGVFVSISTRAAQLVSPSTGCLGNSEIQDSLGAAKKVVETCVRLTFIFIAPN